MAEKMEGEIYIFIKVWLQVCISLCYCYIIGKFLHKVMPRLFAILPIVSLFLFLPLNLQSVHLGGTTSFFIAWLANFKLLLFAFGKGPLCSDPSLSLARFVVIASLPIKIHHKPINTHDRIHPIRQNKQNLPPDLSTNSILKYTINILLLGLLVQVYEYSEFIHHKAILLLYCLHAYVFLDLLLASAATLARFLLRVELEPQFDKPYLSNSPQNFWGRRWNIEVSRLLRLTVYEPLRHLSTAAIGRKWASMPAVFGTFCVSALMHELIYYYIGRVKPTWEISCFFFLHGFCVMTEIGVKKALKGQFQLPPPISHLLTIVFLGVSGFWLFFPQLLRCRADVRALEEYSAVGALVKGMFIFK